MLQNRPPIIVILGHVDHGKTTLLDYLRKSNVAAREAGGITQHIRSFQLTANQSQTPITFIDTPGHEAFAAMRSRGSQIADIAILVVAATDGVMPQTKQSIEFIRSANIPFIVALNKSDVPTADPIKVKTQLAEINVLVEDFGGNVPCVSISAKTGQGIPDLLELINLLSEMTPPQADPTATVEAVVLESRLDPNKGPLAVVIVKSGTMSVGQQIFQASEIGKVRALIDPNGQQIKSAVPSMPVEVIGLSIVPAVGSLLSNQVLTEKRPVKSAKVQSDVPSEVSLILKCDVAGSLEAILASLPKEVAVLSSGTGEVTENDVDLAKNAPATIFAFNTKVPASITKLAEINKVKIKSFKIIYELLDSAKNLLAPKLIETVLGRAVIAAEFEINGEKVAGCRCTEGVLSRGDVLKIMRQDKLITTVKFKSLQSGKLQVEKVKSGTEFGASFNPSVDFKLQDSIIAVRYDES